ncbi:MAG: S16 family serine protease, partial [Candidatus Hadarchaeia archaeon]
IRNGVVITGSISPDGEIGPVGGVKEKAEAAEAANMEIFLVPEGQSVSTPRDLEIREVSNLNEATDYFYE